MSDQHTLKMADKVTLLDLRSKSSVTARLISLSREVAKLRIDQEWWNVEGVSEQRLRDEVDYHWKWKVLVSKIQNIPYVRSVAVVLESGSVEGAMIYRVDAKSVLELGQRAVLIDRLATAPRNRDDLSDSPCYRGAGSGLLMLAVRQSFILGLEGRVTLFAAGREQFYLDRGFVRTEVIHDEMPLFELPKGVAMQYFTEKETLE